MIAAVIVCMKNGRKEKGWDEAAHEQEAEAKKKSLRALKSWRDTGGRRLRRGCEVRRIVCAYRFRQKKYVHKPALWKIMIPDIRNISLVYNCLGDELGKIYPALYF